MIDISRVSIYLAAIGPVWIQVGAESRQGHDNRLDGTRLLVT